MAEIHFLDTSALDRAVSDRPGDAWVRSLLDSRRAVMSLLALTESRSIVNTRLRRGLGSDTAAALWEHIRSALDLVRFTDLDRHDFEAAQELLGTQPHLRAGDAIHLAAALRVFKSGVGVTFVTADRRQAKVAERLLDEVRLLA